MKNIKVVKDLDLKAVTGGDWASPFWNSWGYTQGKKATWNLKHPFVRF
ncbi:hypothetical protein [Lentilactobacillus hilgardii]|uniref:Plantaricin NC8 alpha peptide n=1 Tax=Lentilactobacillus hilgardii TaxID=1588 RepID=A0A6P1E877_LENHI|nr:hypothetical protein [Lentilactobacillus hilgardii]RRG08026.1 MAG: plantaricin NC8 alpha peptide precursor [Lactobacillus sp.]EEI72235.1 hypothetical protein HMPREF0496_0513 [Lentilactobacillus hilgardii ATCC 27305]MCT3392573.1 plantaricin NC8 alpha peptide precursor [Lentilactobacillus hilgardii]MCV3740208.1 plantaricin NC8 alpha peptide precursor [Lentilactobacillus hilgardii]QHB50913.1 plantaricin NC8 alpha peptide precursor [Lentilactobacillus hilgardii]